MARMENARGTRMTVLSPELDGIDWDNLKPVCDVDGCENIGDFAVEQQHLHPANCEEERRTWWVCSDCYDNLAKTSTSCVRCGVPAAIFKT